MKLKWIGLGAVLMAAVLLLIAAVPISEPTLYNFDRRDFTIDDSITPTVVSNIIKVNLRSSQFSHDANGITLTNAGSAIGTGTAGYVPYWLSTNTLANSWFYRVPGGMGIDTNTYFGPGTTNRLYRNNNDLIYQVGGAGAGIEILQGVNSTRMSLNSSGSTASFQGGSSSATFGTSAGTVGIQATGSAVIPAGVTNRLGSGGAPWGETTIAANLNVVSLGCDTVNFSKLNAFQSSTNNPFVFDLQTAGTAGYPRGFSFRSNGVEIASLFTGGANDIHSGGAGNMTNTGPSVVNMVPVYTDTSGTQVTPTNSISVSTLNVGTISYTNPPVLPSYAVANLPVSSAGAMAWATDILTPIQSDKTVYYDGSNWRLTRSAIKATADLPTFMRNCLEVGWEGKTPSNWGMMMDFFPINMAGYLDARFYAGNSGTGSGVTSLSYYTPEDPCGSGLSAGTTTTGFCYMKGGNIYPIAGFGTILSAHIALNSGLPDGTDNYWVYIGFDTTAAGGVLGANSSGVYYDPYNALGYGATLTNNWQFVNRSNSVGTIVDTGHTADANWTDFTNVRTGTSNIVYINGTAVLTNLTYTQTAYQAPVLQITKTLGTNARYFAVDWVYWAYHFNTARSFR